MKCKFLEVGTESIDSHFFLSKEWSDRSPSVALFGELLEMIYQQWQMLKLVDDGNEWRRAERTWQNFITMLLRNFGKGLRWKWIKKYLSNCLSMKRVTIQWRRHEIGANTQGAADKRNEKLLRNAPNYHIHFLGEEPFGRTYGESSEQDRRLLRSREERFDRANAYRPNHPWRAGQTPNKLGRSHSMWGPGNAWGEHADSESSFSRENHDNSYPSRYSDKSNRDQGRDRYRPRYSEPYDSRRASDYHYREPQRPRDSHYREQQRHNDYHYREGPSYRERGDPYLSRDSSRLPSSLGRNDYQVSSSSSSHMDTRESRERASRGTSGSSSRHTESQARASDNSEYQRNSGSSAIVDRQKATLVKALTLPTNIKHAYPKDAEWKRIITYLRDAQSQESDIQQEKWNDETRYSIEQVWEETAPENYRDQFRNLTHRWYEIDLKELIMWMDAQTRDEASNFDRESIIAHMNQEILNNPLKIDMSKRTERHNDNNILRAVGVLSLEFDRLEYLHHVQVTENEERAMCHAAFKLIDIKGLTPTTLNETMLSIKASTKRSGFQTLLKDVKREVSHYLGQRQHFKQTFEMSSSSTKNFSESKADSRKSSSDNGSTSSGTKRRNRESADTSTRERKKAKSRSSVCKGCGYNFTKDPETGNPKCPRRDASGQPTGCYKDPRRSHEKTAWKDSSVGMKWKAYGYDYLPKDTNVTLDNAKDKKQSFSNKKGIALVNTLRADKILQPELIPFVLSQETTSANKRKGAAASPPEGSLLLDSGALGSNVMSDSYAKRIRKHSDCYSSIPAKHTIVTAANNKLTSNKIMKVNINLVDERSDTANKPVDVSAVVAPIAVDLILDRQTIRDNNLVQRFPSHFAKGELLDAMEKLPQCELPSQRAGHLPRGSDPLVSYSTPIESTTSTNLNSINVNPVMDSWIQSIRRESYKVKQPFLQE